MFNLAAESRDDSLRAEFIQGGWEEEQEEEEEKERANLFKTQSALRPLCGILRRLIPKQTKI